MPRRSIALFFVAFLVAWGASATAQERPDILVIIADDMAWDAVHALGNEQVQTPHLDRLIRGGTTFTHCYNMGGWNGAICIASRTMLNTGRALWHAPQTRPQLEQVRDAGEFWSQRMKAAGYRTYMTGKWHINLPPQQVFDVVARVRNAMPTDSKLAYGRPPADQPDPWNAANPSLGGYWEGGKHWSEVTADDALGLMTQSRTRKEPAFFYIAFNAPHDPRQSPQEYLDRYPVDSILLPENFRPEDPDRAAMGLVDLRDETLAPHPRTPHAVQVHRREYYAIITHLDQQIGRILNAVDQSPRRDRTWIFFTADHGLSVGQHGLLGKQNMYEHSLRAPFIVKGPGVADGRWIHDPIYLQDVRPTTLQLAGASLPPAEEFRSLLPALRGEPYAPRDAIYGAYMNFQRMASADGYKLILYPQSGVAKLFHPGVDPHELKDLLADPAQTSRVLPIARRLFQRLLDLQKETGDTLDLVSAYPQFSSG